MFFSGRESQMLKGLTPWQRCARWKSSREALVVTTSSTQTRSSPGGLLFSTFVTTLTFFWSQGGIWGDVWHNCLRASSHQISRWRLREQQLETNHIFLHVQERSPTCWENHKLKQIIFFVQERSPTCTTRPFHIIISLYFIIGINI